MKFGEYLEGNLFPEWRFYYIDYAGLKQKLLGRNENGEFSERDEANFVEALEREMEKVFAMLFRMLMYFRYLIFEMSKQESLLVTCSIVRMLLRPLPMRVS